MERVISIEEFIDDFVASTRTAIFVRRADRLLLIRPDKTLQINDSALDILEALYAKNAPPAVEVLPRLAEHFGIGRDRIRDDVSELLRTLGDLLNEDFRPSPVLRQGHFDRSMVQYPTLAEIALTYGCQNRCIFCYASSPYREKKVDVMTTEEVRRVMDKIFHQAHVPSLSFTGGEATLRKDLPELISYGKELGFRMNLITNGIRLADEDYARILVDSGLDSAQISLEAGSAAIHDAIAGKQGAFEKTTQGIRNMRKLGVHVHSNTTLCPQNRDAMEDLIVFIARDLGLQTMSMNMVIRTGEARSDHRMEISYSEVAHLIPAILQLADREGIRLVWYSPIPYCLFNPVLHGLGAKSCACIDGILSVNPAGQVLPCSSFEEGIASLLEEDWENILSSRAGRYWKNKEFLPPVCRDCPDADVCAGACPLYWDAAGSFSEIPRANSDDALARRRWEKERRHGLSFGVSPRIRREVG